MRCNGDLGMIRPADMTRRSPSQGWRIFAAAAAVACAAEVTVRSSQSQTQPPRFESGVRLVEVDVRVTDRHGQFVTDLRADDFEITEDGQPQTVSTFAVVAPRLSTTANRAPNDIPSATPSPLDPATARTFVLMLDSPSTNGPAGRTGLTYDLYVRRIAMQFVESIMAPGDAVAAYITGDDTLHLTSDKDQLRSSIERYGGGVTGAIDYAMLTGPEQVSRNLATYEAMQKIAEKLGALSGRRKAIVWIGGQVAFDPADRPCPREDRRAMCAVPASAASLLVEYREALGAATRHNVAIHAVDASGLTGALGMNELQRIAALRMVAEDTGGIAVVGTNDYAKGLTAIADDLNGFYVLGYVPKVEHRDGKFHSIQVRIRSNDVTVRARRGYFAPVPAP